MSRDFDDIYKKIDQSHKELYKQENELSRDLDSVSKNQEKMLIEIKDIKKQVKSIEVKIDLILDILNNFTILLAEEGEDVEDYVNEEDTDSWMRDKEESWNSYEDEDDEEI